VIAAARSHPHFPESNAIFIREPYFSPKL